MDPELSCQGTVITIGHARTDERAGTRWLTVVTVLPLLPLLPWCLSTCGHTQREGVGDWAGHVRRVEGWLCVQVLAWLGTAVRF